MLLILPTLQSLSDLAVTAIEVLKVKLNIQIMKGNVKIEKLQIELEPVGTHAIGFEVPSEYDYEDEDCKLKHKSQIGFR